MNLENYITYHTKQLNDILDEVLPKENVPPETIHRAMRYSVFNGGKRLRPIITIATADYIGIKIDRLVYYIGAMIELVHAYSLVHDDLPSMDNDDLRRGKPTVHKMFNEAIAILTGDALLTQAFEVMGMMGVYKKNGDVVSLLTEFTAAIGSKGLVGGQVMDLEKKNKPLSKEELNFIHKNKTSALITFSSIAVPVFFKKQAYISDMRNYGTSLGMAFQIGDDIVDYKKDSQEPSILKVMEVDEAKKLFYEYIDKAKNVIKYKKEGRYLIAICDWIKGAFNL
ncbi:MAG: polyprenyl synthetase family protein [bacterium]